MYLYYIETKGVKALLKLKAMYTTIEKATEQAIIESIERNVDIAIVSNDLGTFTLYSETNPDLFEGELLEAVYRGGELLDWSEVY